MEVGIQSCGKNDYGQLGIESADFQQSFLPVKGALEGVTIRHLCCGYYHTVVVTARRQVLAFGRNDYGQLGLGHVTQRIFVPKIVIGTEGKAISRVSAGCYHTVLIASDGMLYVFGRNHHGQLGTGDTIERHSPFPIDTFQGRCVAKVNCSQFGQLFGCSLGSLNIENCERGIESVQYRSINLEHEVGNCFAQQLMDLT